MVDWRNLLSKAPIPALGHVVGNAIVDVLQALGIWRVLVAIVTSVVTVVWGMIAGLPGPVAFVLMLAAFALVLLIFWLILRLARSVQSGKPRNVAPGQRTQWQQEWHELRTDRRDFWSLSNGAFANSGRGGGEYATLTEMIKAAPTPKDLPLSNGGDFPQWVWGAGDFQDGAVGKLNRFVSNIFIARTPPSQYGSPLIAYSDIRRLDDLRAELAKFWDTWGRQDQLETVITEHDVGEILKSCAAEIKLLTYFEIARARWSQSQASGKFGLFRLGRRNEEMTNGAR